MTEAKKPASKAKSAAPTLTAEEKALAKAEAKIEALQSSLEEMGSKELSKEAAKKALMNEVVLAWADNPSQGTAVIYVDGVINATFDEKGTKALPAEHIRRAANRRVRLKEEGNTYSECNLSWPMPERLPEELLPVTVIGGLASKYIDAEVKRTDKDIE